MNDMEIQAIGKTLSQINSLRIQRIYQLSKDILRDSGLLEDDSPRVEPVSVQFLQEEDDYPTGIVASAESEESKESEEKEANSENQESLDSETKERKDSINLSLELCCRGMIEEPIKDVNKHPVKGVLFKIDQPSDSAPMIGTGHPLYIPRAVAEEALSKVAGLPLDAHDSLSTHANDQIVGVMISAEIIGEDFVVNGHLWPYNNKNKVDLICSRQEDLGMSMNAYASGHIANLGGREVFWIDKLELLGANILFGAKATYRQTSLAASAEKRDVIIAAEEENKKMDPNVVDVIATQFGQIQKNVDKNFAEINDQIDKITRVIQAQQSIIEEIDNERKEIQASAKQEMETQQANKNREELIASIQSMVETVVSQRINPSGQPKRLTSTRNHTQIAAAAVSSERVELEKQIARIEGRLEVETNLAQQLKLTDELRGLKEQLNLI